MTDINISLRIPDFMSFRQRRFMQALGLHDNEEMKEIKRTLNSKEVTELIRYLNMVSDIAKMRDENNVFIEVERIDDKSS